MKTKLVVAIIASLCLSIKGYGQFSFGVAPGIGLNTAYFGYKINNKVVPYFGFQYLHAKLKLEESGEETDWDLNQIIAFSETNEFSGSLYIPNIGVKYFIKQQNKIQAYLLLSISKPILSGKLKYDGEEDPDFKDAIKQISMWGGEFGFGIEYFFDENFSLGGEFGLRYLHLKYKDSYETEIYDPSTGNYRPTERKSDYRFTMNPTYTKVSFNYYF